MAQHPSAALAADANPAFNESQPWILTRQEELREVMARVHERMHERNSFWWIHRDEHVPAASA